MAKKNDNILLQQLNTFAQITYCVKFFRFLFFFYSFLSFVFWFLNCFEADWLYLFDWLFVIPYQGVSLFYTPQGISADFSLAIIGGISLLLGLIFDFIINIVYQKIIDLEEEEKERIRIKRMREKQITKRRSSISKEVRPVSFENSKLLFLISPLSRKIKRSKDEIELTFQEVEIWKQRILKKLIENINYSKPLQKGYYRKNLFLMYKDFNYTDNFIYYIKPTLDSISLEFRKYGIKVEFAYVLSAITDIQNLENELDCMDTVLSLNFTNETIVTNRFKVTYENKQKQQYQLQIKGEYNLSKNLSVNDRQPLFSLIEKK